jgi:hypothetical protein
MTIKMPSAAVVGCSFNAQQEQASNKEAAQARYSSVGIYGKFDSKSPRRYL